MDLLVMVGMTLVALAVLGYPLVAGRQEGALVPDAVSDLGDRKVSVYQDIKDLEFDREMEKVSEPDYTAMRMDYEVEAVSVLEAMDRNGNGRLPAVQTFCSSCEEAVDADARFCPFCGRPLRQMCPACETPMAKGDRFCGACGQPVAHPIVEREGDGS